MIEAVVAEHRQTPVEGLRILDIGCGNGDIGMHFALRNDVTGVDIVDQRRPGAVFPFRQVEGGTLPFEREVFDLVLSNHVIEHIPTQELHLDEIHRVLKPTGCAYLATPNRSSPIMEGHVGNPHVLRWREMAPLFEARGFRVREMSVELLRRPVDLNGEVTEARWLPVWVLRLLRPFFPSHVYILEPVAVGTT